MADENSIKLNQDHNLIYAKKFDYYAVSIRDWNRLKKVVDNCGFIDERYSVISSFAFGVAGSAFVGWLTLPLNSEHKTFYDFILWIVIVFSSIVGILCLNFHKKNKQQCEHSIKNVSLEIKEIENSFPSAEK